MSDRRDGIGSSVAAAATHPTVCSHDEHSARMSPNTVLKRTIEHHLGAPSKRQRRVSPDRSTEATYGLGWSQGPTTKKPLEIDSSSEQSLDYADHTDQRADLGAPSSWSTPRLGNGANANESTKEDDLRSQLFARASQVRQTLSSTPAAAAAQSNAQSADIRALADTAPEMTRDAYAPEYDHSVLHQQETFLNGIRDELEGSFFSPAELKCSTRLTGSPGIPKNTHQERVPSSSLPAAVPDNVSTDDKRTLADAIARRTNTNDPSRADLGFARFAPLSKANRLATPFVATDASHRCNDPREQELAGGVTSSHGPCAQCQSTLSKIDAVTTTVARLENELEQTKAQLLNLQNTAHLDWHSMRRQHEELQALREQVHLLSATIESSKHAAPSSTKTLSTSSQSALTPSATMKLNQSQRDKLENARKWSLALVSSSSPALSSHTSNSYAARAASSSQITSANGGKDTPFSSRRDSSSRALSASSSRETSTGPFTTTSSYATGGWGQTPLSNKLQLKAKRKASMPPLSSTPKAEESYAERSRRSDVMLGAWRRIDVNDEYADDWNPYDDWDLAW